MTKKEIRVLSDVSKYDQKTCEALATAIEIAYAAAKRNALPNEAKFTPIELPKPRHTTFNGRFA